MNVLRILSSMLLCFVALCSTSLAGEEGGSAPPAALPDSSAAIGAPSAPVAPLAVGAEIKTKKPIELARLAARPEKFVGKTVRVEGKVKAVCQGMGCWVEVEDGKGASFLAKSLDESVLLPKDCVGRSIVVEGIVTKLTPKRQEAPIEEGHACPKPSYVVATRGAMLR